MKSMRKRVFGWYVGAGLALMPFVSWSAHFSPYEVAKGMYLVIWVAGLAVITMIQGEWRGRYDRKLAVGVLGLLVLATVSSWANGVIMYSWWGNSYRFDGLVSLIALVSTAVLVGMKWEDGMDELVFPSMFVGSVMVSILGIEMGNANLLAGYLVTTLPLGIYLIMRSEGWMRWGWVMLVGYQIWEIMATGAWGAWAGLVAMAGVWLIVKTGSWKWLIMSGFLLTVIVGLYQQDYLQSIKFGHIVAEARPRILVKGVLAIREKPLLGWGWAQFATAFDAIDWPEKFLTDAYVDRAHSSFLDYGVSMGLPGLLLYMWVVWRAGRILWTSGGAVGLVGLVVLVTYVIHSQTNVVSVAEDVMMWLVVGMAIAHGGKE